MSYAKASFLRRSNASGKSYGEIRGIVKQGKLLSHLALMPIDLFSMISAAEGRPEAVLWRQPRRDTGRAKHVVAEEMSAMPVARDQLLASRKGWLAPLVAAILAVGVYAVCVFLFTNSLTAILWAILLGSFTGLALTLIGMGWCSWLAFEEGPGTGLLFVLVPPYMVWYGITRANVAGPPLLVFLIGLALMAAAIQNGRQAIDRIVTAGGGDQPTNSAEVIPD